jgi:hypothetical protein
MKKINLIPKASDSKIKKFLKNTLFSISFFLHEKLLFSSDFIFSIYDFETAKKHVDKSFSCLNRWKGSFKIFKSYLKKENFEDSFKIIPELLQTFEMFHQKHPEDFFMEKIHNFLEKEHKIPFSSNEKNFLEKVNTTIENKFSNPKIKAYAKGGMIKNLLKKIPSSENKDFFFETSLKLIDDIKHQSTNLKNKLLQDITKYLLLLLEKEKEKNSYPQYLKFLKTCLDKFFLSKKTTFLEKLSLMDLLTKKPLNKNIKNHLQLTFKNSSPDILKTSEKEKLLSYL